MLEAFIRFLGEQGLCHSGERILVAISGGIDSVVMGHLFREAGYTTAIVHCNFQLRGEDSDSDEVFVRALAAAWEVPVYVKRFETEERANERGISVQMAARELRYGWFDELLKSGSFDLLATAHNRNDAVETFLLNLSRGTGLRGLTGIPARNGKIIRPLLFATRREIETYATVNRITFRLDASNLETKYHRNKIRHDVIPVLERINPGFIETMASNMSRFSEALDIYAQAIEEIRLRLFTEEGEHLTVDIHDLRSLSPRRSWFYELFSPFGFTGPQCEGIEKMMDAESGKRSISATHQLFKDRDRLILIPTAAGAFDRYYLEHPENDSRLPFAMDVELLQRSELDEIPDDPMTACLDYDEIEFPLTIRHWLQGDYFYPLGMEHLKKLSDFFVDIKIPVPRKERIWILASGKKIVWIMGYRIDHRFRITDRTRKVLLLRLQSDIAP